MSACKPIAFKGITRQQFKAVRARIVSQADKTTQVGDTGTAEGFGFAANWAYDERSQTLTIHCTSKPPLFPEFMVRDKLQALVDNAKL
jgi:hypothetical protein